MISYRVRTGAVERIKSLGFDPRSLPRASVETCDLCRSTNYQIISWIDRYGFTERFLLCEGCGLVFLNPGPTAKGYELFYQQFYRPLVTAFKGRPETPHSILPRQHKYAEYVLDFLESGDLLKPGLRVVDIGGSTGVISRALTERGAECLVLDPSPDELDIARGYGLQTQQDLIETSDLEMHRFDMALICQTVDHFLSVRTALEKVHQILIPSGILFVDVTDFETAARCNEDFRTYLKLDHCFYLSDQTMRAYLKATGFEVLLSDISQHKLTYACRSVTSKSEPERMESYARAMSALLREKLITPAVLPFPVDPLTRIWRRFRYSTHNR
jgi:2-polyprenyl-3-methyl-5-hydroxy-6-metoxy-1,4-benzoquinol methylase